MEDNLWFLADGLEGTFIAGRTITRTGVITPVRDLTVQQVQRTFDKALNASASTTDTWNLPKQAFRVLTYTYETQAGIADIATTQNQAILSTYFQAYTNSIDAPTLLNVREEKSRTAGVHSSVAFTATSVYTVDLSQANAPLQTVASMSWAPFQRKPAGIWESYQGRIDTYMELLDSRVRPAFAGDSTYNYDRDVVEGATLAAKSRYAAMIMGMSGLVDVSGRPVSIPSLSLSNADVVLDVARALTYGKGSGAGAQFVVLNLLNSLKSTTGFLGRVANEQHAWLKLIGEIDPSKPSGLSAKLDKLRKLSKLKKVGIGIAATAVVVFALLSEMGVIKIPDRAAKFGLALASTSVMIALQVKSIAGAVSQLKAATKTLGLASKAMTIKTLSGVVTKANALGAVASVVVTVAIAGGLFAYQLISGSISVGSVAFNTALSEMIASVAVAVVILLVVLFIPVVGQLIVGVIAIIDLLVSFICSWTDADEEQVSQDWGLCGGITGIVTKLLQMLIYSNRPVVDMYKENRPGHQPAGDQPERAGAGVSAGKHRRRRLDVDEHAFLRQTREHGLALPISVWRSLRQAIGLQVRDADKHYVACSQLAEHS
ncbi:MAG: hypothetical protein HYX94_03945 [Chloroflexi bacterium]|nr:hypothetical protein [Chloroflexota bacterium]